MSPRVSVIGTGYLGATHAAGMAELGFEVLGVDVDEHKVRSLASGVSPFYEPGLDDLLQRHVGTGRLRFTTSPAAAAEFADLHFVCVGTPERHDGPAADLSQVVAALNGLLPHLRRRCLIVGKSTVPVGTATRLRQWAVDATPDDVHVDVAWNPEFLREGHAVHDTLHPDRLVFGVATPEAERVLRGIYASSVGRGVPVVVTDLPTAELVKVSANSFLATKISFINAMAELCEATGADVAALADAIGHDDRIGRAFLDAGLGYGGGCLPKDVRAFVARAAELDAIPALGLLREVEATNLRRRQRVVALARQACSGTLNGSTVGVLGAAFKPHSDDVRDSPALDVATRLHREGADVSVYDQVRIKMFRY